MELIERYVKDVSRRLPEKRRADVEMELRSAILDALEGRGGATEEEQVAVLREFGDPSAVAASYEPESQYLIGPELYPAYRRVLAQALAAVVALAGLWLAVRVGTGAAEPWRAGDALLEAVHLAFRGAVGTLIGITATFVVLQRLGVTKSMRKSEWDPRTLPALLQADRVSRVEAAFSLLVLAFVLAIVSAIAQEASSRLGDSPGALRLLVREGILGAVPWLVASVVVEAVMHGAHMVTGRRGIWTRVLHLASDALGVVAFVIAGLAVVKHRDAVEALGVPDTGVTMVYVGLFLIAVAIVHNAIRRERRITARRRAERAGGVFDPIRAVPSAAAEARRSC